VVFRLGARTLDLGGPAGNPEVEFGRGILGGFRLTDGLIVVPDIVRVQYFDAQGRRSGTLGRSGSGPSEFRSLSPLEFCRTRGDSIVAGDYRNGRFAVIHNRRVVRTTSYSGQFGATLAGCFDDATVLMQGGLPNFRTPTYTVRLNRLRLDGTLVHHLGDFVLGSPSPVTGLIHPTIRSWGQRVYVGDGVTSEIRIYHSDGRLTHIIRTADTPRRLTAAEVEQALSRQTPAFQEIARVWRPQAYPTFGTFAVDAVGRLWIQDGPPRRADRDGWTAFDVDGRVLGRLEVPRMIDGRPYSVAAFGENEVQVRWYDADGFAHLSFIQLLSTQR
jgi:hypothetical protein